MNITFRCHCGRSYIALVVISCLGLGPSWYDAKSAMVGDSKAAGVFAGSSPCGAAIRPLIGIPAEAESDLIQWKLTLNQDPKPPAHPSYQLHCEYGLVVQGRPGLGKQVKSLDRQGSLKFTKGIKSDPDAVVLELDGVLSLLRVDPNILHILNPDRSLMTGNGGWSYTLNRAEASEPQVDPALAATGPDMSYPISPVATGSSVFGVFEGRSPCQGVARDLGRVEHAGCTKAKWRVTLYQNAGNLAPTTYKVEGTLYRHGAREGDWSVVRGSNTDPKAVVLRLGPTKTEPALFLLKADENVLFFLDQNRKALVGHAEFSYTLNRK